MPKGRLTVETEEIDMSKVTDEKASKMLEILEQFKNRMDEETPEGLQRCALLGLARQVPDIRREIGSTLSLAGGAVGHIPLELMAWADDAYRVVNRLDVIVQSITRSQNAENQTQAS